MAEIEKLKKDIVDFKRIFKLKYKFSKAQKEILESKNVEDLEALFEKVRKAKERKAKREAKKKLEKQKEALDLWLKGESNRAPNVYPLQFLRIRNKWVESTGGSRVTLGTAKQILEDMKTGNFKKSYEGFDFIRCDKHDLVIGCHTIQMSEVKRIKKLLLGS